MDDSKRKAVEQVLRNAVSKVLDEYPSNTAGPSQSSRRISERGSANRYDQSNAGLVGGFINDGTMAESSTTVISHSNERKRFSPLTHEQPLRNSRKGMWLQCFSSKGGMGILF